MDKINETLPTNKITIKGTSITEYEFEIDVPAYYEHGHGKYKIVSEDKWIRVGGIGCLGEEVLIIVYNSAPSYAENVLGGGKQITEENFNEALETAFSQIQNLNL